MSGLDPRRMAAMLALLALVFHALLPLTQNVIRQVQAANGIELVVLCSALGFRTIALKDGMPVDADPAKPQKAAQNCPFCPAAGHNGLAILPVGLALALPGMALTILFGAAQDSTLAQDTARPPQARAPPASRS